MLSKERLMQGRFLLNMLYSMKTKENLKKVGEVLFSKPHWFRFILFQIIKNDKGAY